MELEPLASAAAFFRHLSAAQWEALPHIARLVSEFLDVAGSARWTIDAACERGIGLRLLKRLAAHEVNNMAAGSRAAMDPFQHALSASKALVATIRRADDVDTVRWLCQEYCPRVVPVEAMLAAAQFGRPRVMTWLCGRFPSIRLNEHVAERAVEGGQLGMLQWVLAQFDYSFVDGHGRLQRLAATRGHLEIVQWLHECECKWRGTDRADESWCSPALAAAIEFKHLEIVKFLVDHGYQLDVMYRYVSLGIQSLARTSDLETIKWLCSQQFARGECGWMNEAAAAGNLHVVKWIHENIDRNVCSTKAMDEAASGGHLDIVQWLHANRSEGCTVKAMNGAARGGYLEVVQWLHANRTEGCTTEAMDGAARSGHLDVVQWLHGNRTEGCTTEAMDGAAEGGHLKIVQWLHGSRLEGCTTWAMDRAASSGRLDIVQWLHIHRTEGCTTYAMDFAATGGHLEIVKWLHQHRLEGCTAKAMDGAARCDHLDVVEWLHQYRTEGCTTDAMDKAESLQILKWLDEHRVEGCTREAARGASIEKLAFLKGKTSNPCERGFWVNTTRRDRFEVIQWLTTNYPDDTQVIWSGVDDAIRHNLDAWMMYLASEIDKCKELTLPDEDEDL